MKIKFLGLIIIIANQKKNTLILNLIKEKEDWLHQKKNMKIIIKNVS
jgi:hypothetical protein